MVHIMNYLSRTESRTLDSLIDWVQQQQNAIKRLIWQPCCGCYRESQKQREIATLEARVYRLSELLSEQRAATRDNVQRKQARTDGERDEDDDMMAEPASDDSDVDDDNDVPYNPKNLPLGWDGKVTNHAVDV